MIENQNQTEVQDEPTDWEFVAKVAMSQRDEMSSLINNLQINLNIKEKKIKELREELNILKTEKSKPNGKDLRNELEIQVE